MDFNNNPSFEVIPTKDLTHAEWLDLRRQGIGGSDLAGIMGMSNYSTPIDIYLDKTGQTEIEEEENPLFWWGHKLEPLVIQKYELMYPGEKIKSAHGMLVSKAWPWMVANPDGIISNPDVTNEDGVISFGEKGVFEIKTIGFAGDEWGHDGGNEEDIPEKYYCQVAHYLAVTGFKYAVVAAFFMASREIRRYFIDRDESVTQNIVAIEDKFWHEHVIPQEPPSPTNSADCNKLWMYDKGTTITAGDDIIEIARELQAVKKEAKRLVGSDGKGGQKSELEAKIKNCMGDNQILIGPDGKKICSWKTQTARRFQIKEFAETYPELDKEFRKKSTSRVFRLGKGF
jgi:putative phage-type endonuclease